MKNQRLIRESVLVLLLWTCAPARGNVLNPDIDYFPSRLHAVVYRNWDIVSHERLGRMLGADAKAIDSVGGQLGLRPVKSPSAEESRRNVEIVLRRNWGILPRTQIEELLGFSSVQLDDFLGKEIFLRVLLAAPPPGLTPIKYVSPDSSTEARVKWFSEHVRGHLKAVDATAEEPRLAFVKELSECHHAADSVLGIKPAKTDADLRSAWKISGPEHPDEALTLAVTDFASYCEQIQHTRKMALPDFGDETAGKSWGHRATRQIRLSWDNSLAKEETFSLKVSPAGILIQARKSAGFARALVELERRMAERGGPFLAPAMETNSPSFNTRYVFSYFSLLTDVLGQDLVEPFPEGYLNELFHQDANGIWVYSLMQDLVPSPEFEEIRSPDNPARLARLRSLVARAAKHNLKVYLYFNEPRAQSLSFFERHPDVKGQPEGNTAALCTSTLPVQKHLRSSFEKLFREVPGLGGVFVITASENLANCYSHGANTSCPRCSKRSAPEVIAESIRCMAEGVWAADPEAKFIVWDWSWHSVLGEAAPGEIIQRLPRKVALMADFERGTHIVRGGVPMSVEEYSISTIGPSPRAQERSRQAKEFGFEYFGKIQLSTTWECGTVPFIPVPNLLARKATALRDANATGVMETWTIGSYPSPNTEAFAVQNWNPDLPEREVLRRVAAKRYGPAAAESAVAGWTKLSAAFHEEYPFPVSPYTGPLQHGPSLPWYRHPIPKPYGNATLLNSKDDWRAWPPPYGPDLMAKLLRHLCDRWDEGLKDLEIAIRQSPRERKKIAQMDREVAWMVAYYYRSYANALDFYKARDAGDFAAMKTLAAAEIKTTEQAFRLVRADSRIGWEPELQYFYRPLDVLEKLLSLDAVLAEIP